MSGADHIARWNGTTWSAVGEPEALNGPVNTIALSGTEVLVGGEFTNAGSTGSPILSRGMASLGCICR
ncbi:hypothetical protein [Roseiflexus sp.]|uniref:hypothetical protein n=1 Tax=Roseiflexus sp. TaxID=2562120 RepID=UPI002590E3E4|nr:hypothetical protein [Roseiflexus sp.]